MEAYWSRKRRELSLLASAAHVEVEPVTTVQALVAQKLRLRALLRSQFVAASPGLAESNLGFFEVPRLHHGALAWSYQRFDLRWWRRNFLQAIYPDATHDGPSLGLLADSGMGAVCAILDAMDEPGAGALHLPHDAYFETLRWVQQRRLRHLRAVFTPQPLAAGDVLLLDSIARHDPMHALADRDLAPASLVIADTTCWSPDSPRITPLVARVAAAGKLCVLVRSHIKLDSLGIEYGRLGSIVVTLPPRPSASVVRQAKLLRRRMRDYLVLTSGGFAPENLFPLAGDPEFLTLNRERNRILVANHQRAEEILPRAAAPTKVLVPHHGCFLLLAPIASNRWQTRERMHELASTLTAAGIWAQPAPSFGYDFVGLSVLDGADDDCKLRVTLPDLPPEECDRALMILGEVAERWLPA